MITSLMAAMVTMAIGAQFQCVSPTHHDGDAIKCENIGTKSMRLYAIDAPEMPGACRRGRDCTPGDPFKSRDNLTRITANKPVRCRVRGIDHYKRYVVQCYAASVDISCAQVRDRQAVERYTKLEC